MSTTENTTVQPENGGKTTMVGKTKVHWDDRSMRSAYANVCNVATTREEVMLLFGTSQAWSNMVEDVTVDLSDRIILNPFAAKRLLIMLAKTLEEYEKAYGSLG